MSIEDVKLSESRIRSNVIYCHCPKCTGLCNDYIRAGTQQFRLIRCHKCNVRFKVNIEDFKRPLGANV